jgi:hypothetical protein
MAVLAETNESPVMSVAAVLPLSFIYQLPKLGARRLDAELLGLFDDGGAWPLVVREHLVLFQSESHAALLS